MPLQRLQTNFNVLPNIFYNKHLRNNQKTVKKSFGFLDGKTFIDLLKCTFKSTPLKFKLKMFTGNFFFDRKRLLISFWWAVVIFCTFKVQLKCFCDVTISFVTVVVQIFFSLKNVFQKGFKDISKIFQKVTKVFQTKICKDDIFFEKLPQKICVELCKMSLTKFKLF